MFGFARDVESMEALTKAIGEESPTKIEIYTHNKSHGSGTDSSVIITFDHYIYYKVSVGRRKFKYRLFVGRSSARVWSLSLEGPPNGGTPATVVSHLELLKERYPNAKVISSTSREAG